MTESCLPVLLWMLAAVVLPALGALYWLGRQAGRATERSILKVYTDLNERITKLEERAMERTS